MRMALMDNQIDVWQPHMVAMLQAQIETLDIECLVLNRVGQHQQQGLAELYPQHFYLNDGITRIYQDNPGYQLGVGLPANWQTVFSTIYLRANAHMGQAILCRTAIVKLWYRQLAPQIKLLVVETQTYVIAVISTPSVHRLKAQYLLEVHDLLRAQIKPVILCAPYQVTRGLPEKHWESCRLKSEDATRRWPGELDAYFDFGPALDAQRTWKVLGDKTQMAVLLDF
ncbi:hypothetical protein D3P96_00365 [Weissella viridescens]|uniref:Uncharacterized protein n=1 Tax=Weissella viridescens TaxID=1629 RepID=A0A3P2RCV8_WEIVI|nr:hypothetical protein [Weissella viridescens]RRG18477.1 hypothetical protein D3P96_00365 [Weissella viridescens]